MDIWGKRFTVRRIASHALFLIPTVVYAEGVGLMCHLWHSGIQIKYHPSWVRKAWREMEECKTRRAQGLCCQKDGRPPPDFPFSCFDCPSTRLN